MIWKDNRDWLISNDLRKWTFTHLTAHLCPYIFRNIKRLTKQHQVLQKQQWKTWQSSGTDGVEGNPQTKPKWQTNIMISVWNLWHIMKPSLVSCLDKTARNCCFEFLFFNPSCGKDWALYVKWLGLRHNLITLWFNLILEF